MLLKIKINEHFSYWCTIYNTCDMKISILNFLIFFTTYPIAIIDYGTKI